ncbi:MAG: ABC transporter ATP-binding protein [Alphaproteobacteria bacterium]|nr:ABC transporter ATP-binding protein [Alphaproteobacteria bacterium]
MGAAPSTRDSTHSAAPETSGPGLAVTGVVRRFGAVVALGGVDLAVRRGELLTLLGPSGSGKTTLLKVIAGFEIPDQGSVFLGGQDVTFAAPAKRDIGMVFQNYALFPHMTIAQNIAFPLEMRKVSKAAIRERVDNALKQVDLPGYGERLPKQLSGGQQQRAALARAIVFGPSLLLLDEPFGALDRKLREQMQLEVRRLQQKLGLTAVFVTHDQEEALIMSDRIAVMEQGRIAQLGTPQDIYHHPANRFVAGFMGESNLMQARLTGPGTASVEGGASLRFAAGAVGPAGSAVGLLLRLERPRALKDGEAAANAFAGSVVEVIYLGETVKYRIRLDPGFEIVVRWPYRESGGSLKVGDRLRVGWDAADMQPVAWT